jgi:primary-amine oxidase
MIDAPHLHRSVARFGVLAVAAALLAPPPEARAQVPGPASKEAAKDPEGQETRHVLDPLEPAEIEVAVEAVRKDRRFAEGVRFVSVGLKEPSKEVVRGARNGERASREAFLILLDSGSGRGYEADVDLGSGTVKRYEALPEGVQPPIMIDEFVECEEAVRTSPAFREAMKKRGIEDLGLVMVDAWSAGLYGNEPPEDRGKRLVRALCWVRAEPRDNGYARPVENIVAVVDLNRKELVRLEDYGVIPLPPRPGNWSREFLPGARTDLRPVEVSQAEGASFGVQGHEVKWQKWSLRVGFNPREGLVLYAVDYDGRPVLYRASIAEMIVPYADPKASSYHKNVFDLGEYGVGMLANSLALGCDCLGTIRYFDGHMADSRGRVVTIKNAICLHEEDAGMLWKHTDWRTGQSEVRRSRRLAVSMVATVGNYDYGFYWYLYQDGTIQMEVKLTGIMNTTALKPGESARYGTEVAPGLNAPYHQHYFNARLDLAVDGEENAVQEVNTRGAEPGPENPHGSAFFAETTPLRKESEAARNADARSARFWRVINPGRKNGMGQPVAYRLCPGETTLPFARPDSSVLKRAGFLACNLWVTPFDPKERFPAGDYPNQNPGGDGLTRWTKADRDLSGRDLVLWYTFGQTHVPRLEDWPVMPVTSVGFMLKPDGFFDLNPAMDVPAPEKRAERRSEEGFTCAFFCCRVGTAHHSPPRSPPGWWAMPTLQNLKTG